MQSQPFLRQSNPEMALTPELRERKREYMLQWRRRNRDRLEQYRKDYDKRPHRIRSARANTTRWKQINPDRIKESGRNYYQKNRNRILNYAAKQRNRDDFKEKNRNYQREWARKQRQRLEVRILGRLRSRIYTAIRSNGGKKFHNTEKLIGCDIEFLKWYIESRFTEGMSWDKLVNGEIHIDHHIPCAEFDLTDETQQKQCFYYSNLRPMWWLDNLHKAAQRPPPHQGELI